MAAAARAAHPVVDRAPLIFTDDVAHRLLGDLADELVGYHRAHGDHPVLAGARAQAVVRSRYAEDRLAESGARQYVVLGAGLDTFACRRASADPRVFEVDHPATQAWKRRRLAEAGIPTSATHVPADLERDPLLDRLTAAGFDPAQPAFVSWLGVTTYLTRQAVDRTVAALAGLAPGSELVLDHVLPPHLRDEGGNGYARAVAQAAADGGEPWLTCLDPADLASLLAGHGFTATRHATLDEAVDPALWRRSDALRPDRLLALAHSRLTR
ncbi:SAM-dependent methyltransferase [Saccharothrix syringae]|uniref:S-adenosyl-L-methionine-dependent methyltransferase n=2 Tax=Saccharothrix syringae TaxID=103733 RepID=A0A5Q0HDL6_SACSY|nr:SAM-dependent methyltransferase [Saccharothrix syringae]